LYSEGEQTLAKIYDPHDVLTTLVPPKEYALDRNVAELKAKALGLTIVDADDYTLQLDFDSEEQYALFLSVRLPSLVEFVPVSRVWWTESKNGNKHVFVRLVTAMPALQRIALQATLGSDPTREFLCLMNELAGTPKVLLFEKPDAAEIVVFATDGYQPQLTAGPDIKQIALSPADSEFIAAMEFGKDDVVSVFRLTPEAIVEI
jgi:hypothetical protein